MACFIENRLFNDVKYDSVSTAGMKVSELLLVLVEELIVYSLCKALTPDL